jgi:hypothetical protein
VSHHLFLLATEPTEPEYLAQHVRRFVVRGCLEQRLQHAATTGRR